MLGRLQRRPTCANVVSTLALFVALGGVTWAAATLPRNGVGPRQLKRNAVTSVKIENEQVRTADVANDDLTGTDIVEGSRSSAAPRPSVLLGIANLQWHTEGNTAPTAGTCLMAVDGGAAWEAPSSRGSCPRASTRSCCSAPSRTETSRSTRRRSRSSAAGRSS